MSDMEPLPDADNPASTLWRLGPIAAIAVFLVWWIANDQSQAISENTRNLNRLIEVVNSPSYKHDIDDISRALEAHVSETNFYLRQVCINTSQTEAQRSGCIMGTGSSRR